MKHSRKLSVAVFVDEKTTEPCMVAQISWEKLVERMSARKVRDTKSGPMIGGYQLEGKRCDANVSYRSMIQLDIDTEGEKDKETGRITRVTRPAPALDEIMGHISGYEWVATSTHGHEPQRNVNKFRITILPDRDIEREEYRAVLEALDEKLGGVLDKSAWAWSQAFYLPSCPAVTEDQAFFHHNVGAPAPVDDLVNRGREIIAERDGQQKPLDQFVTVAQQAAPESEKEISRVTSMLDAIPASVERAVWRDILWAVASTGWTCGKELARPFRLSAGVTVWDESEILRWINTKKEQARAQ